MKTLLIVTITMMLAACGAPNSSTDREQAKQAEQMVKDAARQTGMPNITNFTEKKFQKLIYELRDGEAATYSYFMDMTGHLHFLCESVGYGIPASVQYVNPQKIARSSSVGYATLPQPEPNGLFMPDSLDATYVLCSDGQGSVKPVYSEPRLIVSPFRLSAASSLREQ